MNIESGSSEYRVYLSGQPGKRHFTVQRPTEDELEKLINAAGMADLGSPYGAGGDMSNFNRLYDLIEAHVINSIYVRREGTNSTAQLFP